MEDAHIAFHSLPAPLSEAEASEKWEQTMSLHLWRLQNIDTNVSAIGIHSKLVIRMRFENMIQN